jgi:hypothetical protein
MPVSLGMPGALSGGVNLNQPCERIGGLALVGLLPPGITQGGSRISVLGQLAVLVHVPGISMLLHSPVMPP